MEWPDALEEEAKPLLTLYGSHDLSDTWPTQEDEKSIVGSKEEDSKIVI